MVISKNAETLFAWIRHNIFKQIKWIDYILNVNKNSEEVKIS